MMTNLNYAFRKQISIYFFQKTPLTCAGGGGGVLDGPVEAFVTMTDCGSLVVAGAMQRTNGALMVPSVGLEESWLAS